MFPVSIPETLYTCVGGRAVYCLSVSVPVGVSFSVVFVFGVGVFPDFFCFRCLFLFWKGSLFNFFKFIE